jgi:hypothetical protein
MDNFFGLLFVALQEQIKTEVPEIRYIDTDIGQIDFYNPDDGPPPISLPAVLIDFPETPYDQLSQMVEEGQPQIRCRLVFAPFSNTNNLTPAQWKEKGLYYFELEQKLYRALKGFHANGLCQPLNRQSQATEKRQDSLRVRENIFTTRFEDHSAAAVYSKEKPGMEVQGCVE